MNLTYLISPNSFFLNEERWANSLTVFRLSPKWPASLATRVNVLHVCPDVFTVNDPLSENIPLEKFRQLSLPKFIGRPYFTQLSLHENPPIYSTDSALTSPQTSTPLMYSRLSYVCCAPSLPCSLTSPQAPLIPCLLCSQSPLFTDLSPGSPDPLSAVLLVSPVH